MIYIFVILIINILCLKILKFFYFQIIYESLIQTSTDELKINAYMDSFTFKLRVQNKVSQINDAITIQSLIHCFENKFLNSS